MVIYCTGGSNINKCPSGYFRPIKSTSLNACISRDFIGSTKYGIISYKTGDILHFSDWIIKKSIIKNI